MSDWTVVLSSDDAKQVVLYNQKDKQLAVKSTSSPLLSGVKLQDDGDGFAVCTLCKRPFASSSYVYKNYFRVLEEAYEANSPKPTASTRPKIPKTSINTGYYQQFFIELGRLGRGGGGAVFACEHVLNGTVLGRYAVKKVPVGDDTEWLSRLLHEVHILEAMRHENVIEYRHSWLEDWQPSPFAPKVPHLFILMEYAEEGSLEQALLSARSKASLGGMTEVFLAMALGLAHLHSRGILHRDLKPSNILLKRDPKTNTLTPMISDFGEASLTNGSEKSRTGATGTIEYTAPELLRTDVNGQYRGRHSTASDIWSLGMIYYQCLYGRLPFKDIDDYERLHEELVTLEVISVPVSDSVSPPLRSLLRAMLSVNPEDRPTVMSVIEILKVLAPNDKEFGGKLLPASFTPVSLDRPASLVRTDPFLKSLQLFADHKSALHYLPVLSALFKYWRCYPNAVAWSVLAVDLMVFVVCIQFDSILLSLFAGIISGVWYAIRADCCCTIKAT